MSINTIINQVESGKYDKAFFELYGESCNLDHVKNRYIKAVREFEELYGSYLLENAKIFLFSVPGRSELSGNHTDHNCGKVLAGSINLDIIAVVALNEKNEIRVKSEGFDEDIVGTEDVSFVRENEKYKASAIIRGVCDGLQKNGYKTGGFYAYTTSNVLKGSGLSSSAAFEVMIGNILNHCYNGGVISALELAKSAQYAENVHFGKPCGLMDQIACATGGVVAVDFKDTANPMVEKIDVDFEKSGFSLCITNTGGNHADLNEDYASVPADMFSVAEFLGIKTLSETTKQKLVENAKEIREKLGDLCFLRALHFFNENERVDDQKNALSKGDIEGFLDGVTKSGISSSRLLQNIYTVKNVKEQGLSVALALASEVLDIEKNGAYRVHGGGFAGTVQSYVPHNLVCKFTETMENVFGKGCVYVLSIRKIGACMLENLI